MLNQLTISELTAKFANREVSAREATQACLDQIARVDGKIHAFISYNAADALAQADAADKEISSSVTKPLLGVPIAIKDVLAVKNQPLNCASKILGNYISPYDATAIEKLKAAGAIVFGRLNMDEFAMGSSTENSAFGLTRNPWDTTRIPGGSSGGSAAAVAADECIASLGTDTGGSIRQPAALCGCVGLKPTYGRISRYGLVAFASSLDQIGPFTKDVRDSAILLGAMSGVDPRDSTSVPVPVPNYAAGLDGNIKGMKLGLPKEYMIGGLDAEVKAAMDVAVKRFEKLGAEIVEISLPHTDYAVATYYIIATAECSSNLGRYDGVRYGHRTKNAKDLAELYFKSRAEGFGAEVKRRIILGTYVLSSGYYDAYYLRAQKVRTLIRQDFLNAYREVDVLLTPTSPTPAFKIGAKADPLAMYLCDIYTIGVNLAGLPGISVPCGFSSGGLPIGLQLIGQPFQEAELLAIAHAYEQAHDWSTKHPKL
jgi:aspartyl-tRNA(Asn)/glutamyl-tRNA(Gln) amidotransferase subunit A